jgi:hypothetical protein
MKGITNQPTRTPQKDAAPVSSAVRRHVEMIPIPKELENDKNLEVLAYLAGTSAHGDVVDELIKASNSLGDIERFCPDTSKFLYVAIYTRETIFGFAIGMSTVAFRLGRALKTRAIETGADEIPELGDWVSFKLFRSDWPSVDLKFWATQAYVQIRERNDS